MDTGIQDTGCRALHKTWISEKQWNDGNDSTRVSQQANLENDITQQQEWEQDDDVHNLFRLGRMLICLDTFVIRENISLRESQMFNWSIHYVLILVIVSEIL